LQSATIATRGAQGTARPAFSSRFRSWDSCQFFGTGCLKTRCHSTRLRLVLPHLLAHPWHLSPNPSRTREFSSKTKVFPAPKKNLGRELGLGFAENKTLVLSLGFSVTEKVKSVLEKGTSVTDLIKSVTDGQRKFAALPKSVAENAKNQALRARLALALAA
jgi:hypothetical protein